MGVAWMLQWCYIFDKEVLNGGYRGITGVLQVCYRALTVLT